LKPGPNPQPYEEQEAAAVAGYFDAAHYLAANPEVRESGLDPLQHFLRQGWREGRNPSADFDVAYYLRAYPDVVATGVNPLLHYVWAGKAEGRLPRRPMDEFRSNIERARHPREKAAEWGRLTDHGPYLERQSLTRRLAEVISMRALVVSVSHDDYHRNLGGVQNLIRQERAALERAGCAYLHIAPLAPLPLLAETATAQSLHVLLRLGADHLGVATMEDLAACLEALSIAGARLFVVVHHLLGHSPEALAALTAIAAHGTIAWIHDYFTLCANYTLLRNDVRFCGAPPPNSGACGVCAYGADRAEHMARVRRFFDAARPLVLAPSETALEIWRSHGDLPHRDAGVQPPARLVLADDPLPAVEPDRELRVAHLGMPSHHKGWPTFAALARRCAKDPAYGFYRFGAPSEVRLAGGIRNIDVRVSHDRPNAMIEAISEHRIDVVVNWSPWPETFCYTVHEALAGGAFVLASAGAGHVSAALRAIAPEQGCVLESEAELFRLFEERRLARLVRDARRRRGVLIPEAGSAPWIARVLDSAEFALSAPLKASAAAMRLQG